MYVYSVQELIYIYGGGFIRKFWHISHWGDNLMPKYLIFVLHFGGSFSVWLKSFV